MPDAFISYSRKDKAFVQSLHKALSERKRDTWVDWEGIPPTAEWLNEIRSAIEAAQAFFFVISPDSVASDICKQELAFAVAQNKRLIPIVCKDAEGTAVPDALAKLNWIFFRDSDNFDPAVDNLIRALDTDLDWVRTHTRLLVRAREWEAKGRDKSLTLRGNDLKVAEQWLIQASPNKEPSPTLLHSEYILVSRKSSAARQRVALGAVALGLVVAITLGVIAFFQRQSAISRELAAYADSQLSTDPELSVLLAKEAVGVSETAQAEEVLRRALLSSHVRTTLRGHTRWVTAVAFSPDGKSVLTTSFDDTARLWDAATGRNLHVLRGHKYKLVNAAFSPDGKLVVTAAHDNTARVWDAKSGRLVTTFHQHGGQVDSAAFSPDSALVVTASKDKSAMVWEARTGKRRAYLHAWSFVTDARFSPDGKLVVAASADTASVWDATGAIHDSLKELTGHTDAVNSVAFSPDGKFVVTASSDNTARVWNVDTGQSVAEMRGHTAYLVSASFSADGTRVVTASGDGTARVWDAATGANVAEMHGHTSTVRSAEFDRDGRYVVTAGADNTARVWEADTGREVAQFLGHTRPLTSARFSPDGKFIVTSSEDKTARVWAAQTAGAALVLRGHTFRVLSSEFSPDGKLALTGSMDDTAQVWNLTTGKSQMKLGGPGQGIDHGRFSRDAKFIITSGGDTARLWDIGSGRPVLVQELNDPTNHVQDADLSPDGTLIASVGSLGLGKLWDVKSGKPKFELKSDSGMLRAVAFSPDGKRVVTGGSQTVAHVFDATNGLELFKLQGHTGDVVGVRFSPDGKTIATASWDGTARLWDSATGQPREELIGHSKPVESVRFSADGKLLVTASDDRTVRIWDATTGQMLKSFHVVNDALRNAPVKDFGNPPDVLRDAAFSPDGQRIITASEEGLVRIYTCPECGPLKDLLKLVPGAATRQLTPEERQRYLNEGADK